jgi:outer membrane protein assembly factor BamB
MDVPELIASIQTHLPVRLDDEQIATIRDKLADKPELQQALGAELATDNPPANFEEVIARLQTLAQTAKKTHPLRRAVLAIAFIGVIVGAGLVVRNHLNKTPPALTSGPATQPANRTTTRPNDTHITKAPTTRPTTTNPRAADDPGNALTGAPLTQPAKVVTLPAAFPMDWSDYALAGSGEESNWRANLSKLFRPTSGAKTPKLSRDRKYADLSGTYRLGSLPVHGRLLRLELKPESSNNQKCDMEFWNANSKVLITINRKDSRITMQSIARKDFKSAPVIVDSADDHYRWQSHRCYGVDIRHQDGRMMICRGEVPLLSVVMDKPPTEGKFSCSNLKLTHGESRVAGPLAIPVLATDQTSIRKTNAAEFEWKLDPTDKKSEEVELIIDKPGGTVSMVNRLDHIHAKASFSVNVEPSAGVELTVHVTQLHPSTVLWANSAMAGADYIRFYPHEDRLVTTDDRKQKADAISNGRTIGKEVWLRVRTAGDLWSIWLSPDSKRWWRRRSGQSTNKLEQLTFGFELPTAKTKDKGPRRTTIGQVTVRRFEAFTKLADPKLVAKANAGLAKKILQAGTRGEMLAHLAGAADKNASQREWRMACNTALASRAMHWTIRSEALGELLIDAIANGDDSDLPKIMIAINELSEIGWQTSSLGAIQHKAYEALARRYLDTGKPQAVAAIVNASYMSPLGRTSGVIAAPGLVRIYLQNLISRGKWKTVRREAMRAMYHAGSINSWANSHLLPLAKWALSESRTHLANKADPNAVDAPAVWRHPLVVNDDREMLNTLGEFMFLVKNKHYEPACKAITGRTLLDALVSLGDEESLLQSSHFRVRETIRNTPELRDVLKRDYSEIGMIRLERARRQNDLAALKSLAVQFYGTAPGFGAMHVLADRDLSNGNFWGAASRYKMLASEEDYEKRSDAAAKFRLASAMLGRLVGKPADKPVALPGGTFSAQEFEQMITRLAADRKTPPLTGAAGKVHVAPGPSGRVAKLTHLTDVPGGRVQGVEAVVRPAVMTVNASRLIVGFFDKLFAVDTNSRRVVWSHEPDSKQRSHRNHARPRRRRDGKTIPAPVAKPLLLGDKMYVRYGLYGRPLTCVDTKTGKFLWSKAYDDTVLSDPIMIGSWVSVITARQDTSARLLLHRVSPETGESSLSSELVRARDLWPSVGRPAILGDSILFRAEGCLVNCDVRGAIRWARRLPFVPSEALPDLHANISIDDIITSGPNVILSLPGCPYIMCISAQSGQTVWSFMINSPTRLVGMQTGNLIVIESDRICALDPDTGKLRWQRRHSSKQAAVLPGATDTLAIVHLPKRESSKKAAYQYIRWISSKDGHTVKELPIAGGSSLSDALLLSSDGKRIFGMTNYEPRQHHVPKIFMIEIQN